MYTYFTGSPTFVTLSRDMACVVQMEFPNLRAGDRIKAFYRVVICDEIYFCSTYSRVFKRNSFTVLFKYGNDYHFGKIIIFYLISSKPVAIIKKLRISNLDTSLFGVSTPVPIYHVIECDMFFVVPILNIVEKCVFISVADTSYIARFPSKFLSD